MSEAEYDNLACACSPPSLPPSPAYLVGSHPPSPAPVANTPPPYRAAMDLASKFGSFSLDDDLVCSSCSRAVRGRCQSMDSVPEAAPEEGKGGDPADEVLKPREFEPERSPFSYEGRGYCNLECFFDAHRAKPGLCMCACKRALPE